MKTVSVHIVTYNSERDIKYCLDALFKQTYPIAHIVVVDNDSQDDTLKQLAHYSEHIMVIQNHINVGFAAAHNQAIQATDSDYVLVLNPDIILSEHYIVNLVQAMENQQRIGSATGMLLSKSNPQLIDSTGLVMSKTRHTVDRGSGKERQRYEQATDVFGVSGAAALYARQMIDDISIDGQFFDESFFTYKEDIDVAWRAQLLGWQSCYVPVAIAYHERGWKQGNRQQVPLHIRRHSYINRYMMMFKNESFWYLIRHSLYILGYEMMSLGYFLIKEPRVLRAWATFFHQLPQLKYKRKWMMTRKKVKFKEIYHWFR